jgi:ribosome maturation factor RimP
VELEDTIRSVVEVSGLELVEVALHRGRRSILRVTVDREGGVDLDTISLTSERISRRLDLEGFDPGPYDLEVSSPGIERPLRTPLDFARRIGQRVRVKMRDANGGSEVLVGTIAEASPDAVLLATDQGERSIGYDLIAAARTVADWNQELKKKSG